MSYNKCKEESNNFTGRSKMTIIEILHAMNTEQQPLHWTKKQQNDAIDAAEKALGVVDCINLFLNERKRMYQLKVVRLEKSERNARFLLEDEPDRKDVNESLSDIIKLQDRYNALISFIDELLQEQLN